MKKLQILGTGCTKCKVLAEETQKAADAMGLEYELEKVTDIEKIMSYGILSTPALVVDGKVKLVGRVPSQEELKKALS